MQPQQPSIPPQEPQTPLPPPPPPPSYGAAVPGGRTLQPLTSEDVIRQAAYQNEVTSEQGTLSSEPLPDASPTQEYEYASHLIEEPLHPVAAAPQVTPGVATIIQNVEKPRKKRHPVILIVSLVLVGAIVAGAYWLFMYDRVTASDLVTERADGTTYLRPKQWKTLTSGTGGFGNGLGKDGKSSALIAAKSTSAGLGTMSATNVAALRDQMQVTFSKDKFSEMLTGQGLCRSVDGFKQTQDTASSTTTAGLLYNEGVCHKDDGDFIVRLHVVIGIHDGRPRIVMVAAQKQSWDRNQAVYQKMLDSVQESESTT